MLSCLDIKNDQSDKIIFLAFCTNSLSHVQNYVAVITCVNC
jgi:hypothetical protein